MVGTSGMAGERASVVTATARTVPLEDVFGLHRHAVDHHGDAAGQNIGHRRDGAAIGNMHDVDAGLLAKQFLGEMHRRARARRGVAVFAGVRLQQCNELLAGSSPASVGDTIITGANRVAIETGARSCNQSYGSFVVTAA